MKVMTFFFFFTSTSKVHNDLSNFYYILHQFLLADTNELTRKFTEDLVRDFSSQVSGD